MRNFSRIIATSTIALALTVGLSAQEPHSTNDVVHIKPSDLPKPYATPSANFGPRMIGMPEGAKLKVPEGFKVEIFAEDLSGPRSLTVAPNGDVFVVESAVHRVICLRDTKGTGKADVKEVFAEKLKQPFGIQFYGKHVYIGNTDSVVRFPYTPGQTKAVGEPEVIISDLPAQGYRGHWTRNILIHPKTKKIFVTVGSETDIGEAKNRRAVILQYNLDGSGEKVYASGLRNAVGLDVHPKTGQLWTSVNERDGLGDDLVPDYVTSVKEDGFYGWPWYYIGANHDPRVPENPSLKDKTIVPDVLLTSHSAALGLVFYTGKMFPKEYQGDMFVALHGSGNRSKRTGYNIVRVKFKNGKPVGSYEPFVSGWMFGEDMREVWGRPTGVAQGKDGSLFIAEDGGSRIFRVSYDKKK